MWLMKRLMEVGFQLLQTGSSESVFKHLCDSIDYIDMHRLYPWIGWDLGPTDNATGGRHRSEFGYVWQDTQNTNRTGWEHGESTGPATGLWESHIDSLSAWEWFLGMSSLQERKQSYIDIYIYTYLYIVRLLSLIYHHLFGKDRHEMVSRLSLWSAILWAKDRLYLRCHDTVEIDLLRLHHDWSGSFWHKVCLSLASKVWPLMSIISFNGIAALVAPNLRQRKIMAPCGQETCSLLCLRSHRPCDAWITLPKHCGRLVPHCGCRCVDSV